MEACGVRTFLPRPKTADDRPENFSSNCSEALLYRLCVSVASRIPKVFTQPHSAKLLSAGLIPHRHLRLVGQCRLSALSISLDRHAGKASRLLSRKHRSLPAEQIERFRRSLSLSCNTLNSFVPRFWPAQSLPQPFRLRALLRQASGKP